MPRKKGNGILNYFENFNWQDSYASLILGAIIVIILGLLVANYFSKKTQDVGNGQKVEQEQQQVQSPGEYKIVENDSLSKISQKFYGSMDYWPILAQVNKIQNPNIIYRDTTIKVPSKQEADSLKAARRVTSYQVQAGDTFFTISEKVYGDGSKWTQLHRANGLKKLPNGNPLVIAGTTIVVPR